MWINMPTPVTMSSMSRLSGSIRTPIWISRSPTVSQLNAALLKAAGKNSTPRLNTNEMATAPMESLALKSRSRWVNNVMTAAAASGRNRMMKGMQAISVRMLRAVLADYLQTRHQQHINDLVTTLRLEDHHLPAARGDGHEILVDHLDLPAI